LSNLWLKTHKKISQPRGSKALLRKIPSLTAYTAILTEILTLTKAARHAAARSVNSIMTATYWEIGRRVIEYEQGGAQRAGYGEYLMKRLAAVCCIFTTSAGYCHQLRHPNLTKLRQGNFINFGRCEFIKSIVREIASTQWSIT
jgi:hypothetical protein